MSNQPCTDRHDPDDNGDCTKCGRHVTELTREPEIKRLSGLLRHNEDVERVRKELAMALKEGARQEARAEAAEAEIERLRALIDECVQDMDRIREVWGTK